MFNKIYYWSVDYVFDIDVFILSFDIVDENASHYYGNNRNVLYCNREIISMRKLVAFAKGEKVWTTDGFNHQGWSLTLAEAKEEVLRYIKQKTQFYVDATIDRAVAIGNIIDE